MVRAITKGKQAERALQPSRELLNAVLENALDGILVADVASKRFVFCNPAMCRMLGYERDELLALDVMRIHPPKDLPRVLSAFETQARGGHTLAPELPVLRKDGSVFHADISSFPVVLERQACLVGFFRDITERRQAAARIAHLGLLYATLTQVNQTIVRVKAREELFPAICRAAVEHGGLAAAWLGLLDRAAKVVTTAAAHGAATAALSPLRIDLNEAPFKAGPMDRALATGQLALIRDLQGDPGLEHWRALAETHGLHAIAIVPFRFQGDVAGFLVLASEEVDYFADEDLQSLIAEMATDISFALDAMEADAQRRHAEKSLRDLAHAVNASGDVMFTTAPDGTITSINAQFTRLYGFTAEEVVGRVTPRVLKSGRHPPEFYEQTWARWLEGETIRSEIVNRTKDGRLVEIETCASPFHDAQGRLAGFMAIHRDISARKRAEAESRLLQAIALGVGAARDLDEAIGFVLRQVCDTTGWAMGEAWLPSADGARLDCHPVWHDSAGSLEAFRQVSLTMHFAAGEGLPGRVWLAKRPEWIANLDVPSRFPRFSVASQVGLEAGLAVPVMAHGEVVLVLEFFLFEPTDEDARRIELITAVAAGIGSLIERRQVEEKLRQAQRMEAIGHLAGGVAHDFNNILATMLMQLGLTASEAGLPARAREGLQQVRDAAERAVSLTRQLLLFSRQQVMQPRDLDLNGEVASLAGMLRRIIGEDVRLELALHPAALWTRVDAGMLDQVLMNLAVNARDAMPRGGHLRIETSARGVDEAEARRHPEAAPGLYVCMRVSDTGGGIAPGVLPHIFEPFFTTKDPGKGTGLGLATVFGIVKQHHGWLDVTSEPGRGTSFEVFLPALSGTGDRAAGDAVRHSPRGGTETILLVEDDPDVRVLAREVLERGGYRVLEAASGVEAIRQWPAARGRVALLLTDLVMPDGLGGHDLATRLRADRPGLKVIYMSGYSADIAGRELDLHGGERFLQKPFANDVLLDAVRLSLDTPNS